MNIKRLCAQQADFDAQLDSRLAWDTLMDAQLESVVRDILHDVRQRGDAALLEYNQRFDQHPAQTLSELIIEPVQCQAALASLPTAQQQALQIAAQRIRSYHQHQCIGSWQYQQDDGTCLGQQVTAMERIGVYAPGGSAALASSVLMNAIAAQVAGVEQIVLMSPAPQGQTAPLLLAAAALAGVTQMVCLGGAQAIAALAYGSQSLKRVDKIVGPGNRYVTAAKRQVFGQVGIDMIAGPSEILVICDGHTDPNWVAMDLCAQAEHDVQAQAILIALDSAYLDQVEAAIAQHLLHLPRAQIIRESLAQRGLFIVAQTLEQAIAISNRIAPEHLELSVETPEQWLPQVRHAGAIFLGRHTAEALGDYCAGPNHVLPTCGSARFFSPLGVYDFQKRSSVIHCSAQGASVLGPIAAQLARGEGLEAHARSAEYRIQEQVDEP